MGDWIQREMKRAEKASTDARLTDDRRAYWRGYMAAMKGVASQKTSAGQKTWWPR